MNEVKNYEITQKIDTYFIYELIKTIPNDMVLGQEIRKYINEVEEAG